MGYFACKFIGVVATLSINFRVKNGLLLELRVPEVPQKLDSNEILVPRTNVINVTAYKSRIIFSFYFPKHHAIDKHVKF